MSLRTSSTARTILALLGALGVAFAPVPSAAAARPATGSAQAAKPVRPPPPRMRYAVCATPTNVTPSNGGKYRILLAKLKVEADCASYGSFNDWGHYPATTYGGQGNLPAAYWVYHYPHWYLWKEEVRPLTPPPPPPPPPPPACRTAKKADPSVGGKYRGLLRTVPAPGDCASYGAFHEYGHYPATSYGGQANLPAAYWVYAYPAWYLWQRQTTAPATP